MDPRTLATTLFLCGVWPGLVGAGPYKCVQPDGSIVYQEVLCAIGSDGAELTLDPPPPRRGGKGKAKDYSVEGQLKALEAEHKKTHRRREKAPTQAPATGTKSPGYDRAKCAKQRAEAARWRQQARRTYRDTDERDYRQQQVEYYEALADQYCRPD